MAYNFSDLTNAVAASSDYPNGDIKDNPGGTLVNRAMLTDMLQTLHRAMILAGITPNGDPDNVTNGYQMADALGLEAWKDGPDPLGFSTPSGGSISGGTVGYNKIKTVGKTFYWQLRLVNATIASSPTLIVLDSPFNTANFPADSMQFNGIYNNGTTSSLLIVSLNGPTGFGQIQFRLAGGAAFTNGTTNQSFYFNIMGELP